MRKDSPEHRIIDVARSLDGLASIDSTPLEDMARAAAAGELDVVPLYPNGLNSATRALRKGAVMSLAGPPGVSKSFWISQNVMAWRKEGVRVAVRNLEDTVDVYLARVLAQLAGKPDVIDPDWIRDHYELWKELYQQERETLDDVAPVFECDDSGQVTLPDLLEWAAQRVCEGFRVLVIDTLTGASGREKPWMVDGPFIRQLKSICSNRASAIVVTHTTKDGKSIAGGADIERFVTTALELQPNHEEKSFTVIDCHRRQIQFVPDRIWRVVKARHARHTGARIATRFDPEYLTFNDVGIIVPSSRGGE